MSPSTLKLPLTVKLSADVLPVNVVSSSNTSVDMLETFSNPTCRASAASNTLSIVNRRSPPGETGSYPTTCMSVVASVVVSVVVLLAVAVAVAAVAASADVVAVAVVVARPMT